MFDTPGLIDAERHFSSEVAILCLFKIPDQATDWHWKKIAGVPFILRNILNLQRGGIGHVLVYMKDLNEIDGRRLREISSDSRVRLRLEWIFESKRLVESARGNGAILIVDGSVLHSQVEVVTALKDAPLICSMQDKILNRFLEGIDNFSATSFEKILNEDINSEFVGQRRKLIFLPGTEECLIAKDVDFIAQHELLLKGCGSNGASFMNRWVTRPISRRLTCLLIQTPLSPNLIAALGFALGLWAAWFFYPANYWAGIVGALILQCSVWLDGAGNEIGRLEFMESKTASRLNLIGNIIVYGAVFFAIGMGEYAVTGTAAYQLLGGLAVLGVLFMGFVGMDGAPLFPSSRQQSVMQRMEDVIGLLLLMAVINQLGMFIAVAAVWTNLSAGSWLYAKIRPSLIPVKSGDEE